ncbi:MAG: M48 family metallopeptidase [Candidatus Methylacidiphilales bacterium]
MFEQLPLIFSSRLKKPALGPEDRTVEIDGRVWEFTIKKNNRARHYVIYVRRDGTLKVTVPRYGSQSEARRFILEKKEWIGRQWDKISAPGWAPKAWTTGMEVLLEGRPERIEGEAANGVIALKVGPLEGVVKSETADLRPWVEALMRKHAVRTLPPRVTELAQRHGLSPTAVTVRNQSSRWGSCSQAGRLSLNWRLVQLPPAVRDYVILHELMHLLEMNHSARFWLLVEKACPEYKQHERWLKTNAIRLGM